MSFIAIGLGAMVRGAISGWWTEYKMRRASGSIVLTARDGTWQPSRFVERVERTVDWLGYIGAVGIVTGAVVAILTAIK